MEEAMRMRIGGMVVGLAALCAAGLVTAAPCYLIYDQNDAVIYRDVAPPFDLSTTGGGAAELAALRRRGELLLVAEFDHCYAVGYISPLTGSNAATVDEIVTQLKPAIATSVGSGASGAASTASRTTTAGSAARVATPPQRAPARAAAKGY
jgi:hypothetical protein